MDHGGRRLFSSLVKEDMLVIWCDRLASDEIRVREMWSCHRWSISVSFRLHTPLHLPAAECMGGELDGSLKRATVHRCAPQCKQRLEKRAFQTLAAAWAGKSFWRITANITLPARWAGLVPSFDLWAPFPTPLFPLHVEVNCVPPFSSLGQRPYQRESRWQDIIHTALRPGLNCFATPEHRVA